MIITVTVITLNSINVNNNIMHSPTFYISLNKFVVLNETLNNSDWEENIERLIKSQHELSMIADWDDTLDNTLIKWIKTLKEWKKTAVTVISMNITVFKHKFYNKTFIAFSSEISLTTWNAAKTTEEWKSTEEQTEEW